MSFLSTYAHLLGIKPKGARAEGDDDDEKAKKAKARRAEENDDDEENAEENDDEENAEENDDEENADDDDEPTGKKAKGKKAGDDEDEADAKARGRAIERKRCARIFGSKAAGIRPDMAAELAFGSDLSSSAAIRLLEQSAAFGAPQGGRMTLDERMRGEQKHRLEQDAQQPAATGTAGKISAMTALYNQVNGGK